MTEVLYRKYRPQDFSEVIGQDHIKTILKNALKTERTSHAYLFTGPRGTGKTSVARILAKAVNCEKLSEGEPCDTCENCQRIAQNHFLDLVEIDAASYTGVDNIREIIEHVKFTPTSGKFKVFIIDEVHMLSRAAFNALLKTLEEPPEHAMFILATTEIHKVPATIISRTQRFDFRAASEADIIELFERVIPDLKVEVSKDARTLIARAAHGSLRDALSILDQVIAFSDKEVSLDVVEGILGVSRVEIHQKLLGSLLARDQSVAGKLVRDLSFEGKDLVEFSRGFLEYLRLVLLLKMGVEKIEDLGLAREEGGELQKQSEEVSAARLLQIVRSVMQVYRESKLAPVSEVPLLAAVLELTQEEEPEEKKPLPSTQQKVSVDAPRIEPKVEHEAAPVATTANPSSISLSYVVDQWSEVLSKVKEYNHSLISSLRLGRLVKVEGDELVIAFPYNFHKETIDARKNKIVIEQVLEDVFRKKLKMTTALERDMKEEPASTGQGGPKEEKEGDLLNEAIKVLGN